MEGQLTADDLLDLIRSLIEGYQTSFNAQSEHLEIEFVTTLTHHKVPTDRISAETDADLVPGKINIDVAYLRLTKKIRVKGGKEEDWEEHLIWQEIHRFRDVSERTNPRSPWKFNMYLTLLFKLTSAGLEYAELLRRIKPERPKQPSGLVSSDGSPIEVTNQMPAPLTEQELEYKEWLKKNHDTA